jgi:hypothetical protein
VSRKRSDPSGYGSRTACSPKPRLEIMRRPSDRSCVRAIRAEEYLYCCAWFTIDERQAAQGVFHTAQQSIDSARGPRRASASTPSPPLLWGVGRIYMGRCPVSRLLPGREAGHQFSSIAFSDSPKKDLHLRLLDPRILVPERAGLPSIVITATPLGTPRPQQAFQLAPAL